MSSHTVPPGVVTIVGVHYLDAGLLLVQITCICQGRRRRSGWSGFGRTTFRADHIINNTDSAIASVSRPSSGLMLILHTSQGLFFPKTAVWMLRERFLIAKNTCEKFFPRFTPNASGHRLRRCATIVGRTTLSMPLPSLYVPNQSNISGYIYIVIRWAFTAQITCMGIIKASYSVSSWYVI